MTRGKSHGGLAWAASHTTGLFSFLGRGPLGMLRSSFLRIEESNKTVFSPEELTDIYNKNKNKNVVLLEMVYNGYFGEGHNIIHKELRDNGLFSVHPYIIDYNKSEFIKILEMGDANVQNIIID